MQVASKKKGMADEVGLTLQAKLRQSSPSTSWVFSCKKSCAMCRQLTRELYRIFLLGHAGWCIWVVHFVRILRFSINNSLMLFVFMHALALQFCVTKKQLSLISFMHETSWIKVVAILFIGGHNLALQISGSPTIWARFFRASLRASLLINNVLK